MPNIIRPCQSYSNNFGDSSTPNLFSATDIRSRDIEISRREFADDKGIPQDVVFNRLRDKLLAMKHAEALS